MASAVPVPEQPGRLYIPATGSVVQQDQQYEGDFYDTVEFTTFAVGTMKLPFKDQTNKDLQFTNLTQTKRIPSYAKLKLQRLGVHVRQWDINARPSPEDVVCLYEMTSLRFTLGQTNLIAEGPLLVYSSGLGLTGVSTANNFSVLSNGVASAAAAPRLREESDISDKIDLNCQLSVGSNAAWSNQTQPTIVGNLSGVSSVLCSVFLHGIITRPLGS
jgi:hypothetical protein